MFFIKSFFAKMNISSPQLSVHIKQSLSNIVEALYKSALADRNADLHVEMVGVLSYTQGAKLRLSYVDNIDDQDMCEWTYIAEQYGAKRVDATIQTGSAQIELNIEYKGVQPPKTKLWIFRTVLLAIATVSYYHLHQFESQKYPFPVSIDL